MKRSSNVDFQDRGHVGYLGFSIDAILAFFDLEVTLKFPAKFQVKLPFGLGEEAQNTFSR